MLRAAQVWADGLGLLSPLGVSDGPGTVVSMNPLALPSDSPCRTNVIVMSRGAADAGAGAIIGTSSRVTSTPRVRTIATDMHEVWPTHKTFGPTGLESNAALALDVK